MRESYVIVRAEALVDLCALVSESLARPEQLQDPTGPLPRCLRGALAEVRVNAVLDPYPVPA